MKKHFKKIKKKKAIKQLKGYDPAHYFNREISWLEFNSRVLNEAQDPRTPLLERFRFMAIYASNLDEFMMKRVGGLKRQLTSEYSFFSIDGIEPKKQLALIRERVVQDNQKLNETFDSLKKELSKQSVDLLAWNDLSPKEIKYAQDYFDKNLFPILTPLSVDPGKPFPFISNLSLSFGLYLDDPYNNEKVFSRVKVPDSINKWIKLPSIDKSKIRLVNTTEIIRNSLSKLYPGVKILDVMPFRVTRNADWEHDDEDTEDLLELIEESIHFRRLQEPIRVECLANHNEEMLTYLMKEMNLAVYDLYLYDSTFDFSSMHSIADLDIPHLKYKDWRPVTFPWFNRENLFEGIRNKDYFVHHPYENFKSSVEKFIKIASRDPQVMSIKMTLYRTGDNSKFIDALIHAAENGIQVVCLIELKARFDEKRNISGAKRLEEAGVHVVYGVVGLKTHSKIAMVVRRENNGELLRYCHIATGNYNAKTAKLYTDMGLFTTNEEITTEVNEIFNYLTGFSLKIDYSHLLIAPINAKSNFIGLINNQIKRAKSAKRAYIFAKMNSLEDPVLIEHLYKASQAGVKVTLVVRGFCCLIPGKKGLSENIEVISIIGRFLEHSRVFFFQQGEDDWDGQYFIGSADWMHRNMHSRVEVITPVYSEEIQNQLKEFFEIMIKDERSAWDLKSDGSYKQRAGIVESGTHESMMRLTAQKIKNLEFN